VVGAQFRRLQAAGRAHQLDPVEWGLLSCLASDGPATAADLAAKLSVSGGGIANALSRLDARELVKSSVVPGGRRKAYRVSDTGLSLVEELRPAFARALSPPDDRRA
jgi:DNA-binding MarR family transcriptional regulator